MNSDFAAMLKWFEEHEVRYLIAGGYAVIHHSEPRFTKDLDLWVEPTKENAAKVAHALHDFGAPLIEITEADLAQPKTQYRLGIEPTCLDILTSIPGLDFAECWEHRVEVEPDSEAPVKRIFLGARDLITSKEVADREQDRADITKVRKALAQNPPNDTLGEEE